MEKFLRVIPCILGYKWRNVCYHPYCLVYSLKEILQIDCSMQVV
jgi:hypothetical protein